MCWSTSPQRGAVQPGSLRLQRQSRDQGQPRSGLHPDGPLPQGRDHIDVDLDCMVHPRLSHLKAKIQRRFLPTNVFRCFCAPTIPRANVLTPFCSLQVVKLKVGGRATVYVGTTLKVRCPVKQYDKWVDFPINMIGMMI